MVSITMVFLTYMSNHWVKLILSDIIILTDVDQSQIVDNAETG
jgi:hypothetical protein